MTEKFFRMLTRDTIIFIMLFVFIGLYGPITFNILLGTVFGWYLGAFFFEYVITKLLR